jgi:hypothetical protein
MQLLIKINPTAYNESINKYMKKDVIHRLKNLWKPFTNNYFKKIIISPSNKVF